MRCLANRTIAVLVLATLTACAGASSTGGTTAEGAGTGKSTYFRECVRDVQQAAKIIEANYAGWDDKQAQYGGPIASALGKARQVANAARDAAACDAALAAWVRSFGDAHLRLQTSTGKIVPDPPLEPKNGAPSATLVGGAVVLTIPAFTPAMVEPLRKLLDQQSAVLGGADVVVVDVRGASGEALEVGRLILPLLGPATIRIHGHDVKATSENVARLQAADRAPEGVKGVAAQPGQLVPFDQARQIELPAGKGPRRVVFVVDSRCAEACEELLVWSRQSDKALLVGQPSHGSADYAVTVVFDLPSKQRKLIVPTVRSRRVPDLAIDGFGVAPDVTVDAEELAGLGATDLPALADRK